jgi:hypothetical protein
MPLHICSERLYDFEATLRLVDNALDELRVLGVDLVGTERQADPENGACAAPVADLMPLRVYREVQEGLHSLRHGRSILERTSEAAAGADLVSTGSALSGLDRALTLVARFQGAAGAETGALEPVREEIELAMDCLRTRGVTEQQLTYAASILLDMDNRLVQLAEMLDPYGTNTGRQRDSF